MRCVLACQADGGRADAFNADCLSVVPSKGTVGASGDLAPLSHLALGLMGEGDMWDPRTGRCACLHARPHVRTCLAHACCARPAPASEVLAEHGLRPIRLKAKEGLAMINGTQVLCSDCWRGLRMRRSRPLHGLAADCVFGLRGRGARAQCGQVRAR